MEGATIRQTFLQYFEARGHTIVPSSPLVPRNDPSLFFVNAGMVQFKQTFTGDERRNYSRAVSSQKCLRVSGKHNDLENVGFTPRHHTFFEMLGNFSFGDYFKQDAIQYAWDLLTNVFGIDPDLLWITVFREDDAAEVLWRDVAGVAADRIVRLDEKDNFWSMGDTGPCGPCSEIHVDIQAHAGKGLNSAGPGEDPEGYLEIWNLVFMQSDRSAEGVLNPLPSPSIDTGMGLERIASVLQKHQTNYETDLFLPVIETVAALSGHPYGRDPIRDTSMRVIADHARAAAFLIGDGIMPSNEERGYVLRRIMRRAIRHGVTLGMTQAFLYQAVEAVVEMMSEAFPELKTRATYITEVVENEEQQFARTLDKGLKLYRTEASKIKEAGQTILPGDFAFKLSDTYGFPLDLTQIIAGEDNLEVDEAGFDEAMAHQRQMARAAWKGSGEAAVATIYQGLRAEGGQTTFLGYEATCAKGKVQSLLRDGQIVDTATQGDTIELLVDKTPFYAESGGQVGDRGKATLCSGDHAARAIIEDTQRPLEGLIIHHATVTKGTFRVGDCVQLEVDADRRTAIRRNHTATHLLHAALRQVLGDHVSQRGSLVTPDRLRFDFSHFKPLSLDELRQVETWVNRATLSNLPLEVAERSLQEATEAGVTALFGEKYGDRVRVVCIPGLSAELCGGTHVDRTGDIGSVKIVSEAGIQAGVRRLEAVSGMGAYELMRQQEAQLRELADGLKTSVSEVASRVHRLQEERKTQDKHIEALKRKLAQGSAGPGLETRTRDIAGVKVISMLIETDDPKALREQADRLRDTLGSGIVVLGARTGDKATLLVALTKDLSKRFHAGKIIKALVGLIEGRGGGRPDMAQAGGNAPEKLPECLDAVYDVIASQS